MKRRSRNPRASRMLSTAVSEEAKRLRLHSADFELGPGGSWKHLELSKRQRRSGVPLKMLDQSKPPLGSRVSGHSASQQNRCIFDPAVIHRDLRQDAHCIGVHRILSKPVAKQHLRLHPVARAQRGGSELTGNLRSRGRSILRRWVGDHRRIGTSLAASVNGMLGSAAAWLP